METSGGPYQMKTEQKMIIAFIATNSKAATIQAYANMKRMKKRRNRYESRRKRKG